jgi:hypothetical protein
VGDELLSWLDDIDDEDDAAWLAHLAALPASEVLTSQVASQVVVPPAGWRAAPRVVEPLVSWQLQLVERVADALPPRACPAGWFRDGRGTWRRVGSREKVPGAVDVSLSKLTCAGDMWDADGCVRVLSSDDERVWAVAVHAVDVLRGADMGAADVPGVWLREVGEVRVPGWLWASVAAIPFGVYAPELCAGELVGASEAALLADGLSRGAWSAYVVRGRAPRPVAVVSGVSLWSRVQVRRWAASRRR